MNHGSKTLAIAMLVVASALGATAAPARAQERTPVPAPPPQQMSDELSAWLKEYHAWEKWYAVWGNRLARNGSGFPVWERKKRPEPPAWLEDACRETVMVDDQLARACHILWTWDEQPAQILLRRGTAS